MATADVGVTGMSSSDSNPSPPRPRAPWAFWVPGVLFGFAVLLALDPLPFTSPVTPSPGVPAWVTDVTPVRRPSPEPRCEVGVFSYRCSDCHTILPPDPKVDRTFTQHREVRLRHGINTRCLNCHHPTNRDALVDDFGNEIPWDQPQLVCAKCHGPVYRDWQHGSHGRTNGYWLATRGRRARRTCTECHDPHQPPFPPMKPASGPHTLRMGPHHEPRHPGPYDPLRLGRHPRAGRGVERASPRRNAEP